MPQIEVKSFTYSPARQGYDSNYWRTLMGSPAVLGTGRLQVDPNGSGQGGAAIHYADILKGDVSFSVNWQGAPGTDNQSIVGLYNINSGAYVVFTMGATLTCDTSNGTTADHSTAIPWNSDWSGANVDFRIRWEAGLVKYYINGSCVYTCSSALGVSPIPAGPLALYLYDNATGNPGMSVGSIDVRGAQSIVFNTKTSDTSVPDPIVMMSEKSTVTDVPTVKIPILVPSVTDSMSVSDVPVEYITVLMPPVVTEALTVTDVPSQSGPTPLRPATIIEVATATDVLTGRAIIS